MVVVGVAVVTAATRAPAHIYKVQDPATGVIYYTNAPSASAAKIVVRELPRPMPVSAAQPVAAVREADTPKNFDQLIREIRRAYDVEYALVKAVIKAESGFNHQAVSPKGAQGLMQLMPATAKQHGVANAFTPRDNIEGGVRHLEVAARSLRRQRAVRGGRLQRGPCGAWSRPGVFPTSPRRASISPGCCAIRENYRRERPAKDRGPGVVFISGRR